MFRADELLLALARADVRHVIVGGIAVVHGNVRVTTRFRVPSMHPLTAPSASWRPVDS